YYYFFITNVDVSLSAGNYISFINIYRPFIPTCKNGLCNDNGGYIFNCYCRWIERIICFTRNVQPYLVTGDYRYVPSILAILLGWTRLVNPRCCRSLASYIEIGRAH